MSREHIQQYILRIIRHIQVVILLEGDNKFTERPFRDRKVAGETGDWVDLGVLDLDFIKNTM